MWCNPTPRSARPCCRTGPSSTLFPGPLIAESRQPAGCTRQRHICASHPPVRRLAALARIPGIAHTTYGAYSPTHTYICDWCSSRLPVQAARHSTGICAHGGKGRCTMVLCAVDHYEMRANDKRQCPVPGANMYALVMRGRSPVIDCRAVPTAAGQHAASAKCMHTRRYVSPPRPPPRTPGRQARRLQVHTPLSPRVTRDVPCLTHKATRARVRKHASGSCTTRTRGPRC